MSDYHKSGEAMADAIALSSPSGRMSKRARAQAIKRLGEKLFPAGTFDRSEPTNAERALQMRRTAANLRNLAAHGMHVRSYPKEAAKLEAQAAALEAQS